MQFSKESIKYCGPYREENAFDLSLIRELKVLIFIHRHTIPAANECLVSGWNVNRLEFINHYYEENMERCNLRKLIR